MYTMKLDCNLSRNFLLALACSFVLFHSGPKALAAKAIGHSSKPAFSSTGPFTEPMKEGREFIEKMQKDIGQVSDYSFVFETTTFKNDDKPVVEKGKLFFKKPKLMRIEEIGEFNKGAVAVIGKDGKARAHGGGVTSFFTVTTTPDDKMLNAANGDKMEDSDFASLVRVLEERLKSGQQARVTERPINVEGIDEAVYVLEIFHPNEPKKALKRVFVHPVHNLPVRWDDYDYKEPCLSTWKEIKLNPGLSDDLFKL